MKMKKTGKLMMLVAVLLSLFLGVHQQAQAIQVEEAWGAPTFIYGGGLSEQEIEENKGQLNIQGKNIEVFPVTGEDIHTYLGLSNVSTSAMISSVLVERKGQGVHVEIVTPSNITKITEKQYANAAITAGVENVNIRVVAVRPVTGESALTGVYKAFQVNGEELEQDRMIVAQEELKTTSEIEENMDEAQSNQFNQVIVNIKQTINNFYQENSNKASVDELRQIIQEEIAKADLTNVISEEQINQLVVLFQNYQETSAINSEQVQQQLQELGNSISEGYQKLKDSGFFERIWQAIVNFFNSIFGGSQEESATS